MTHSPSTAQGRWKLQSHSVSLQAMVAPLSPQTKQSWKGQSIPLERPLGIHSQPQASGQGAQLRPLLGHSPEMHLPEEAPVLETLWSCWQ